MNLKIVFNFFLSFLYNHWGRKYAKVDSVDSESSAFGCSKIKKFLKPAMFCHLALSIGQRYTYRVIQTIQMKVILLKVWAEGAVLGRTKTALKFKYEV